MILGSDLPSKPLAQFVLYHLSSEWDDSFVCMNHSIIGRQKVNSIISNCFLKNLAKDVSETKRRHQVQEFKRINMSNNK